jgi:signal transduction histidine kinase
VLFAVAAVLTAQAWLAAVALMGGYLALLWYERASEHLPAWYGAMRRNLTLGVVLAHALFFAVQSVHLSP